MASFLRLLALFRPQALWLALGLASALITLLSQLALMTGAATAIGAAGLGIWLLRLSGIARPLLRYVERLLTHTATFRVLARLRLWLFGRLVPLAPAQLGQLRSGDILARLLNDIESLDGFYLRLLLPLGLFALACVGGLYALASISLYLAIILTVTFPGLLLFSLKIVRQQVPQIEQLPDLQGLVRSHVLDGCEGLADLIAADAAYDQMTRMGHATADLNRAQLAISRLRASMQALAAVVSALVITALIWWLPASLHGWVFLSAVLLASVLLEVVLPAVLASQQWIIQRAACQRIFSLADTPPHIQEPTTPIQVPEVRSISLEAVSLSYGRGQAALDDISLTIAAGERIVITGPSGAGKSSLIGLLLKFWQPTQGRIKINDDDLSQINGDSWRSLIGYLSQQTALLAGTVRENLMLSKPDASDAELWQALEAAGLADFIRTLPEQMDTWIGDNGIEFSGGQARRLALAQVLLRKAQLWLLDEPTEGLDAATAQAIMATLARLGADKTIIMITHQPTLAQGLGPARFFHIRQGKLAESAGFKA